MKVIKKLLNAAVNGKPFANTVLMVLVSLVSVIIVTIGMLLGAWFRGG